MQTVVHRAGCVLLAALLVVGAAYADPVRSPSGHSAPNLVNADAHLQDLCEILRAGNSRELLAWVGHHHDWVSGAFLQVHLFPPLEMDRVASLAIRLYGGKQTGVGGSRRPVQAWIPLLSIPLLAIPPGVGYIRLPSIPLLHDVPGALASNALMAMGASRWHDLGYLGQGIRVGVIDLGYLGYQDLMGSELPSSIETGSFVDGQEGLSVDRGTRHGTAVAEIIHDVAPESDLFLARIATTVDLVEAVEWLLSREVDVICTSLGWFDVSPGDGTGLLADQVNRVRAEGVLWVTSAGDQRQRHWCGDWENPLSGDYYRFTPYSLMNWLLEEGHYELSPGTRIDAYLRWSDWAAVEEDYDLYLWEYDIEDPVPRAVATSTDAQTGLAGQTPTEALTYVTHEAGKLYALSILAHDVSRGVHLELFLDGEPRLETRVASQSLASPADVEASLGVAAVSAAFPYGLLADSSMGPAKGPGGVGAPGIEQPRIAGYGDIETASMSPLGGSSAAAPHAAGAAALILSRYPGWGPDEIESLLIERGEPYPGQTGWDPGIGFGRLYIGDEPAPQPERAYLPMTTR